MRAVFEHLTTGGLLWVEIKSCCFVHVCGGGSLNAIGAPREDRLPLTECASQHTKVLSPVTT